MGCSQTGRDPETEGERREGEQVCSVPAAPSKEWKGAPQVRPTREKGDKPSWDALGHTTETRPGAVYSAVYRQRRGGRGVPGVRGSLPALPQGQGRGLPDPEVWIAPRSSRWRPK